MIWNRADQQVILFSATHGISCFTHSYLQCFLHGAGFLTIHCQECHMYFPSFWKIYRDPLITISFIMLMPSAKMHQLSISIIWIRYFISCRLATLQRCCCVNWIFMYLVYSFTKPKRDAVEGTKTFLCCKFLIFCFACTKKWEQAIKACQESGPKLERDQ